MVMAGFRARNCSFLNFDHHYHNQYSFFGLPRASGRAVAPVLCPCPPRCTTRLGAGSAATVPSHATVVHMRAGARRQTPDGKTCVHEGGAGVGARPMPRSVPTRRVARGVSHGGPISHRMATPQWLRPAKQTKRADQTRRPNAPTKRAERAERWHAMARAGTHAHMCSTRRTASTAHTRRSAHVRRGHAQARHGRGQRAPFA